MVNLRTYLFAGILAACGGEESPNQPSVERSSKVINTSLSQEQKEAQKEAARVVEEQMDTAVQKAICPTPKPEGLVALIIEQYRSNPARLRSTLDKQSPREQFHIYQALGDTSSASALLNQTFQATGVVCPGYEPSVGQQNQRAAKLLERDWSGKEELNEAFALFTKTENLEGQLQVLRKYEELINDMGIGSFERNYVKNALKFCDTIGDVEQKQRLTNIFFSKILDLEDAAKEIQQELGIEPTPAMYSARGDYWLRSKDDSRFKLAFESYQHVNDNAGVRKVLQAILSEEKNVPWLPLAVDVALFLKDARGARQFAEDYFVKYDITGKQEVEVLQKGGSPVNSALLQRRGEYQLQQRSFEQAYEAFQKANDVGGMLKVAEAITTPKN